MSRINLCLTTRKQAAICRELLQLALRALNGIEVLKRQISHLQPQRTSNLLAKVDLTEKIRSAVIDFLLSLMSGHPAESDEEELF